jgi:hypothetical protein
MLLEIKTEMRRGRSTSSRQTYGISPVRFYFANYANRHGRPYGLLEWFKPWSPDECLTVLRAARKLAVGAHHRGPRHLEMMADSASGQPHTAHTTDPVLSSSGEGHFERAAFADVAPTVLDSWTSRTRQMTGKSPTIYTKNNKYPNPDESTQALNLNYLIIKILNPDIVWDLQFDYGYLFHANLTTHSRLHFADIVFFLQFFSR